MKSHFSWIAAAALAVLSVRTASAEPSAADRVTARALAEEGGQALDRQQFDLAVDRFSRADALVHAPTLVLELAHAQIGLGQYVEAHENLLRIVREGVEPNAPRVFHQAYERAQREEKEVASKIAWVTVHVTGARNTLTTLLDGEALPRAVLDVKRALNPGTHVIRVTGEGYRPAESSFSVVEGQSVSITVSLDRLPRREVPASSPAARPAEGTPATPGHLAEPPPSPVPLARTSPQRAAGWVGMGVGAAGLIVGGIAGVLAMQKHDSLDQACPGGLCQPSARGDVDDYHAMANASTAAFVVGAAAVAAGAVLYFTAPRREGGRFEAYAGLGTAGARVTFE